MKYIFESGNISDVGKKRTRNEDYFGQYEFNGVKIYIVCDGMGGYTGGEFASRLAVNEIKEHFESLNPNTENFGDELKSSLLRADAAIKKKATSDPEMKEMGSTAVVLLIKDGFANIAHLGDSRVYLHRDGMFHRITKDHSLVQQMVDGGIIDAEQAKTHPNRNVISRSLGPDGSSEPEVEQPLSIYKNDIFLLCTDGLTSLVEDEEIKSIIEGMDAQSACIELVNMANDRGGNDNITIQIVKVVKGKSLPPIPEKKKTLFKFSGIGLGVFLLLLISFIFADDFSNMLKTVNPVKNDSTNTAVPDTNAKNDTTSIDTSKNKVNSIENTLVTGAQNAIEQVTPKPGTDSSTNNKQGEKK
ncbi:MAG: Stp1/IreP family PP2C-type Ser/Thr phosphatase [Ignavibacteriaceae bacterium]|nr:Stp1/IreP family PP2C-type Ser/Thr phosphatase [Ignavibacteriaceae bacterium]